MRSWLFAFLLLIPVILPANSFPQNKINSRGIKELSGKWEALDLSQGMSLTYEYMRNNQFRYMLYSTLYGKYKLNGKRLISMYKIPSVSNEQADTSYISAYLDTLYQVTVQGKKEILRKMVRLNGKARPGTGIIGEWIDVAGSRKSIINFKPDGQLELKHLLRYVTGKYIIRGDNVSVISRGTTIMKNRFVFDKGFLLLYSENVSAPIKLKRAGK